MEEEKIVTCCASTKCKESFLAMIEITFAGGVIDSIKREYNQ